MLIINRQVLVEKYSIAIDSGEAAIFAGAGLSIGAGYVDWVNLLEGAAKEIRLNSHVEKHDLVSLAQYYLNESGNNRGNLNEILNNHFGRKLEPTENHRILAKLPISTYWSTNYDCLIEKALENSGKVCDVKYEDSQLKRSQPNRDVTVYKMHGDVNHIDSTVITRDDYQVYERYHSLTREVLEGDMLTKTFLFIGVSFSDPNINYILGRIRVLLSGNTRTHYCFLKRILVTDCRDSNEFAYKTRKQELQINDLGRYGISVCLVNEYDEITEVLKLLYQRYKRKTIFISGSADVYDPFTEDNARYFLQSLAARIISRKHNYRIVSGYGYGVGEFLLNGVVEECQKSMGRKLLDCITLLPIPYRKSSDASYRAQLARKHREEIIGSSGLSMFVFGNKRKDGILENADGMRAEYDLASELNSIQLPVPCTGYMSKLLYEIAQNSAEKCPSECTYASALELCNHSLNGTYTQRDIDKLITSLLGAIDLMNAYADQDEVTNE